MDKKNYGDNRIIIVCGKYEGINKKCADYLYGEIAHLVPYILTVTEAEKLSDEQENYYNIIAVGTPESNPYIALLCQNNLIHTPSKKEEYTIKVFDNPKNNDRQIFALCGSDLNGALYAISEFCSSYLPQAELNHDHNNYFTVPFTSKMPEADICEAPQICERGIWTWGHVIFDYKKFIKNMVRLKMNTIIIWNDHAPLNALEIVEYAHSFGISVIWGISFGWGYDYDISSDEGLEKIIDAAVSDYETNYAHLGGDGIYFQTFTETNDESKDGLSIAAQAVHFVNMAKQIVDKRLGNIRLQFGLHATSVKNNLGDIAGTNKDVEIVWEDCGAFPFAYIPRNIENFEESCEFVKKAAVLRGDGEKFSVVLKGLTCLDWTIFEHQKGSYIMGINKEEAIQARLSRKQKIWHYVNSYWIRNADKAQKMIQVMKNATAGEMMMTALIEDGMFEEKINYGASVMAQIMWNCEKNIKDIMCDAALIPDIVI
ncbi:MAG: hypothetical protein E7395_07815 [Ruminococcaceae bacterium]|nr:hypothetical protein [Oscillospiraceae bacterium]